MTAKRPFLCTACETTVWPDAAFGDGGHDGMHDFCRRRAERAARVEAEDAATRRRREQAVSTTKQKRARLIAAIAAMPKCPTCGGFATPSTEADRMVCKDHGRFVRGAA